MNGTLILFGLRTAMVFAGLGVLATAWLLYLSIRSESPAVLSVLAASGISLVVGLLGRLAYGAQRYAQPNVPGANVGHWQTRFAGKTIMRIVSLIFLPCAIISAGVQAYLVVGSGASTTWIPTLLHIGYLVICVVSIFLVGGHKSMPGIDYL